MVAFPQAIDVFLPLLDGFSPITQADLDVYQEAIRRLEEVLGAGPSTLLGNHGPKGGNASVRERLDKFLEPDGGLRDVAFVTGSTVLSQFSEDREGLYIPFGKQLSTASTGPQGYAVLFQPSTPGTEEDGGGGRRWLAAGPACWWVATRRQDGVWIRARDMSGTKITIADDRTIEFACLVFGNESFYP